MYENKEYIVYSATKSAFQAELSSGAITNDQIGIIAETAEFWAQGTYRPLVKLEDYLKRDDAVNFANDLTGVINTTEETFTYRASAGDKSIRDESAVIRRIKGNTIVGEQLIRDIPTRTDFEGITTSYDANTNECVLYNISRATNYVNGSSRWQTRPDLHPIIGHKYILLTDNYYKGIGVQINGIFYEVNSIFEAKSTEIVTFRIDKTFDFASSCPIGSEIRFRLNLFDLTDMFGDGNEPKSVSEFRAIFPESYYAYGANIFVGVHTEGIKTIGFNQFNEKNVEGGIFNSDGTTTTSGTYSISSLIKVLPNTAYYLKDVANGLNISASYAQYDDNEALISTGIINSSQGSLKASGGITTASNAAYIRIVCANGYLGTCCVNLRHTRVRDGEWKAYEEHYRSIPEITKYFPNGMHGIGDVYDEINEDSVIMRLGVREYEDGDNDNIEVITNGVSTVYELPDPIVISLSEPIQLDYWVDDWGTEEAIATIASAPFRADIIYQFNAEGRIRDNSRNIERLESKVRYMATLQDVYDAIPTEIATTMQRDVIEPSEVLFGLLPNICHDYTGQTISSLRIPDLLGGNIEYNDVWIVRFSVSSSDSLTIPFNVLWKDGIAPTWDTWCVCEIAFRKDTLGGHTYGEWKIYK